MMVGGMPLSGLGVLLIVYKLFWELVQIYIYIFKFFLC